MCGIFGLMSFKETTDEKKFLKRFRDLSLLSESRGKEASGICLINTSEMCVYKEPIPASLLFKKNEYKKLLNDFLSRTKKTKASFVIALGHSRMVTNGDETDPGNNQPIVKDDFISLHNGIIVNDQEIWKKNPDLKKKHDVDSEVVNSLISKFVKKGFTIEGSIVKLYSDIKGSASIVIAKKNHPQIYFATNTGSLYFAQNQANDTFCFASEKAILRDFIRKSSDHFEIIHLEAKKGAKISVEEGKLNFFSLEDLPKKKESNFERQPEIPVILTQNFEDLSLRELEARENIKRCTKCILPETIPFLSFDKNGVCQKCRSYKKLEFYGKDKLNEILRKTKSSKEGYNCIVGLSGGRDSSFGLHYLAKEVGFKPIAYTYDWGLVTDLARRNISRLCGKLGVEHILVSADIREKRGNIRRNVQAWLKDPRLGMVTLFMAGDKDYFYHAQRLKKELDLSHVFLSSNRMEKTGFKSGFCGVDEGNSWWFNVSLSDKMKMAFYFGTSILRNPGYWNRSVFDTLNAMKSSFFLSHDYHQLFDLIPWNENELTKSLREECDWEFASDTKNSWRIGDGTAAFYNYIYHTVAGFTENDTFRSYQIREGHLNRETALKLIREDNKPRFESIREYAQVIGFDLRDAYNAINQMPKLYMKS